jgi:CHAD domain-containing protein
MSTGHPDMEATSTANPRRRVSPPATTGSDDRTPLAQSLGRRVEALAGHLHAALDGDEHAIHHARVATRRLREILPIVIDTQSRRGERLRRRLKRLTAALGPVRELDVALNLLNTRAKGESAPAVVALRAQMTERRSTAFEHLREACDPGRARRLLARLAELVSDRDLASRRGHGGLPSRERRRLTRGVIDRARDLGIAVADAGAILIVERVHAVRIAAKRLRYALELIGELRLARTATLVSSLRAMQDVLGQLHDLDVLRTDLRGARALSALTDRVRDRIAPCLDPSIST